MNLEWIKNGVVLRNDAKLCKIRTVDDKGYTATYQAENPERLAKVMQADMAFKGQDGGGEREYNLLLTAICHKLEESLL